MKIVKISIMFLAVSMVFGVIVASAADVPSTGKVGIFAELKPGASFKTGKYTKGEDFIIQSYQFQDAMTTITNPCPKCNFKVTLFKGNDNQIGTIIGKTGENFYFDNKYNQYSSLAGDYYIAMKRSDFTAVTSWETGDWFIAKTNSKAVYQD